ncbi:SDR family NAD(P)-dependent oxidoreductase [Megasphaera sp.]|uniref:SDR family NAD(P)-dependent oxidoreductase n=1 Tax=Megasphaera sp. TaxID=2023260 RepID=UPI00261D35EA|nr:SDR family NAD(P)-dependent oxidoreductase [uncultured Megasphaera sp.]
MKTWLITGASSGIGYGIAQAAMERGDKAIIAARSEDKLQALADRFPGQAQVLVLDVSDAGSIAQAMTQIADRLDDVDVLVNNAGYGYRAAVEEGEEAEIRKLYDTNVWGPVRLMKAVLPHMRARKQGTIINVSSIAAVRPGVGSGYYSSSKAALERLSDAVSEEVQHLGIHVMIVEPGAFRTAFFDALHGTKAPIDDYDATAGKNRVENIVNHHDQRGNPAAAGQCLVDLVHKGCFPGRLALGPDALQYISQELTRRQEELKAWQEISRKTDFPKA